jgi:hypothetical protein
MVYSNVCVSAGGKFSIVNPAKSNSVCWSMDCLSCILLWQDCNMLIRISMYMILSNSEVKFFYTLFMFLIGMQFLRMFEDVGILHNSKPSILQCDK